MLAAAVTRLLCANNGAMGYDELLANVGGDSELERTLADYQKFAVVTVADGSRRIIAKTSVKLCKAQGCQGCSGLHLCKFYLFGDCRFNRTRRGCRFCHDLSSEQNSKVLRDNNLQDLNQKELCQLLLQNEQTLLPPVCFSYNRGSGQYGACPDMANCRRLHICEKFLEGSCKQGTSCYKSHDLHTGEALKMLEDRGLTSELISSIQNVYLNKLNMKNGNIASTDKGKTEICLFFVRKDCKHGNKCFEAHHRMPYQWQVWDGLGWLDLTDNEQIEKEFCNPARTCSSGNFSINFSSMTRGAAKVRRLSTASSVTKPSYILTTCWLWYWQDEYFQWSEYGTSNGAHNTSSISSEDLEKKYLEDKNAIVQFQAGGQQYELKFKDMIQINCYYQTKRAVLRRPKFFSKQDVEKIKQSKKAPKSYCAASFKAVPSYWDKTLLPETGYKKITLLQSSEEYGKVKKHFEKTMYGFQITKIERIQNKALWEVFQWQKEQMRKTKNGKPVNEKNLFHGTDLKNIDAICKHNFDWRICGTNGTAYGKGSYFARDAQYSNGFTGLSSPKTMFVVRVLVGDSVEGKSSHVRPPSKDGGDTFFYDSCVDNILNPSIYVVFEKHQIYPEYIIEYDDNDWDIYEVDSTLTSHAPIKNVNTVTTIYPLYSAFRQNASGAFSPAVNKPQISSGSAAKVPAISSSINSAAAVNSINLPATTVNNNAKVNSSSLRSMYYSNAQQSSSSQAQQSSSSQAQQSSSSQAQHPLASVSKAPATSTSVAQALNYSPSSTAYIRSMYSPSSLVQNTPTSNPNVSTTTSATSTTKINSSASVRNRYASDVTLNTSTGSSVYNNYSFSQPNSTPVQRVAATPNYTTARTDYYLQTSSNRRTAPIPPSKPKDKNPCVIS
ncbi:protein mono-ADP-ribosyltransferase PARP12-like isoform X2 [Polypterus senegalus]|uniref:protein mono-ADP-ribosyltransferase PARP12-like isoform X2 n=1 Tax=Polypterus senegalus TaxID=55291 RepID=UPI0019624A11|nr:protein mono-ADP-ribosyltransferase PARP12-like isoform X2 [Polypterus senegalus]